MEIRTYLRVLGRRRIVFVVPLVAGAIATALSLGTPDRFRTEATLALPGLIENVSDTKQFVADLEAIVETPGVLDPVAEEFGIESSALKRDLDLRQIGSSAVIEFVVRTDRVQRDDAPQILQAVGRDAVNEMYATDLARARAGVDAAQADLDRAIADLDAFSAETGQVLVSDVYSTVQRELSDLRVRQEAARAAGNTVEAQQLQGGIDYRNLVLASLSGQVVRYELLDDVRAQALERLGNAQSGLDAAEARLGAASRATAFRVGATTEVARIPGLVRRVASVTVAALVLVAGLVLLLESRTKVVDLRRVESQPSARARRRVDELRDILSPSA